MYMMKQLQEPSWGAPDHHFMGPPHHMHGHPMMAPSMHEQYHPEPYHPEPYYQVRWFISVIVPSDGLKLRALKQWTFTALQCCVRVTPQKNAGCPFSKHTKHLRTNTYIHTMLMHDMHTGQLMTVDVLCMTCFKYTNRSRNGEHQLGRLLVDLI